MILAKRKRRLLQQQFHQDKNNSKEENALKRFMRQLKQKGFTAEMFFRVCDQRRKQIIDSDTFKENISNLQIKIDPSQIDHLLNILDEENQGTITFKNLQDTSMAFGYEFESGVEKSSQFNSFQQKTLVQFLTVLIEKEISNQNFRIMFGATPKISRKQFMEVLSNLSSDFSLKQRYSIFIQFDQNKSGYVKNQEITDIIQNFYKIFNDEINGTVKKKLMEIEIRNQLQRINQQRQQYQQKKLEEKEKQEQQRQQEKLKYQEIKKQMKKAASLNPIIQKNKIQSLQINRPLTKAHIDILLYFISIIGKDNSQPINIFKKADLQKLKLVNIFEIRQIVSYEYYSEFKDFQLNSLQKALDVNKTGFISESEFIDLMQQIQKQNNPYKNEKENDSKHQTQKNQQDEIFKETQQESSVNVCLFQQINTDTDEQKKKQLNFAEPQKIPSNQSLKIKKLKKNSKMKTLPIISLNQNEKTIEQQHENLQRKLEKKQSLINDDIEKQIHYDEENQQINDITKNQSYVSIRVDSSFPLILQQEIPQTDLKFVNRKGKENKKDNQSDNIIEQRQNNWRNLIEKICCQKTQIISEKHENLDEKRHNRKQKLMKNFQKQELCFQDIKDYIINNHPYQKVEIIQNENQDKDNELQIKDTKRDQNNIDDFNKQYEYQKFSIFEKIGTYLFSKKIIKLLVDDPPDITDVSKEIGLGPSLLLLSIKNITIFFFVATIINIPNYFILNQKFGPQVNTFQDMLSYLSIGNLGLNSIECVSIGQEEKKNISLKCKSLQSTIQDIKFIGFLDQKDQTCKNIEYFSDFQYDSYFQQDCIFKNNDDYQQNLFDSQNFDLLKDNYNSNCRGRSNCSLSHQNFKISPKCQQNETSLQPSKNNQQKLTIIIECSVVNLEIYISETTSFEISKDVCVLVVMVTDFITIGLFIAFIWLLNKQQQEYIKRFDLQTIEMSDFTIRLKNLPKPQVYENDERILKMKMWFQIQQIINQQIVKEMGKNNEFRDIDFYQDKYQIADISFSQQNIKKDLLQHQINELKKNIQKLLYTEQQNQSTQENQSVIQKYCGNYFKINGSNLIDEMIDQYEQLIQEKKEMDIEVNQLSVNNKFPVKDFQKFGFSHNSPYFDNDEVNKNKLINAFVVFRSMEGVKLYKKAYKEYNSLMPKFIQAIFFFMKNYQKVEFINGKWPAPQKADNPPNINWNTMGTKLKERLLRQSLIWLVALAIITFALMCTIQLTMLLDTEKKQFKISSACPNSVSKQDALQDIYLQYDLQIGLMHCYCFDKVIKKVNIGNLRESFLDNNKNETIQWCQIWNNKYLTQTSLQYGRPFIILIINLISSVLFVRLSSLGKYQSVSMEVQSGFKKLSILQYLNISILVLLANFNIYGGFPKIGVLNGTYKDFNQDWFVNIGGSICLTLFFKIFTPYISKLVFIFLKLRKRVIDQGGFLEVFYKMRQRGNYNYGIDEQLKDEEKVNSQMFYQSELEILYLNDEISAPQVYAQIISFLWSTMTFSAGLPILYPIAFLNFLVFYWMHKILLLKYYSKSKKLDQGMAGIFIKYMLISVLLHILMTGMMFSSNLMNISQKYQIIRFRDHFQYYLTQYSQVSHELQDRFLGTNGIIYVIYVIALVFAIPSFVMAYRFLKKILSLFYQKKQMKKERSNDIFEELDISYLQKQYQIAWIEKNMLEDKKQYFESKLQSYEFNIIQSIYKSRYQAIYKQIYSYYFNKNHNDKNYKFHQEFYKMKKNRILQLKQQLNTQNLLLKQTQNQEQHQECKLRMNGLIQSYYLEDSQIYSLNSRKTTLEYMNKKFDNQKQTQQQEQDIDQDKYTKEKNLEIYFQQEKNKLKQKIVVCWLIITFFKSLIFILWTLNLRDEVIALQSQFKQMAIFIILNIVSHVVNMVWALLFIAIIFVNIDSKLVLIAEWFKLLLIVASIAINVYGASTYNSFQFQDFASKNINNMNQIQNLILTMICVRFTIIFIVAIFSPCFYIFFLFSNKDYDKIKIEDSFKVLRCKLQTKKGEEYYCHKDCQKIKQNTPFQLYVCSFNNQHQYSNVCKKFQLANRKQQNCPECTEKFQLKND